MVRAGEASGSLEIVFQRLADYTEKQVRMKSQITSAMIYPVMMTVVGGLIVIGLFVFVIPKIRRILESMGKTLPFITKLVLEVDTRNPSSTVKRITVDFGPAEPGQTARLMYCSTDIHIQHACESRPAGTCTVQRL